MSKIKAWDPSPTPPPQSGKGCCDHLSSWVPCLRCFYASQPNSMASAALKGQPDPGRAVKGREAPCCRSHGCGKRRWSRSLWGGGFLNAEEERPTSEGGGLATWLGNPGRVCLTTEALGSGAGNRPFSPQSPLTWTVVISPAPGPLSC